MDFALFLVFFIFAFLLDFFITFRCLRNGKRSAIRKSNFFSHPLKFLSIVALLASEIRQKRILFYIKMRYKTIKYK